MNKHFKPAVVALLVASMTLGAPAMSFAQAAANTITFRVNDAQAAEDLAARIDAAMAQGHTKVVVNLSPYTRTLPEPVAVWVGKIRQSGGEVYVRSLAKSPALLTQLLAALLPGITRLLTSVVTKWLNGLGDPARNYNAMIVTNSLGDDQPDCFVRVEFYLRNSKEWATERAKGVPLAETKVSTEGTAVGDTKACPAA